MYEIMSFAIVLLLGVFSPLKAMERVTKSQESKKSCFQTLQQCWSYKPTNNEVTEEDPSEFKSKRIIAILKQEGLLPQKFELQDSSGWLDNLRNVIRKEKAKTERGRIWQVGTALKTLPFVAQDEAHQFLIEYLRDWTIDPSVTDFVDAFVSSAKSNQSRMGSENTEKTFKLIWSDVKNIATFLCLAYFVVPKSFECSPADVLVCIVFPYFLFAFGLNYSNKLYELLCLSIGFFSVGLGFVLLINQKMTGYRS
jgi:hypothetical protein